MRLSILKFFLALITCFSPLFLLAQEMFLKGVVYDNSNSYRIPNALITNKASGNSSRSNDLGLFEIKARFSDTLSIEKAGYTEYLLPIFSERDVFIRLQPVIALSEVTVKGQTKKQELDEIRREFKKKSYFGGKPPVLAYVFHPITALYEVFGKEPGMARRFNNYYRTELKESEINRRFNATLIKELTGFEGKNMVDFMETYRPSFELLANWDDYELIKYVKDSAITFNSNGRPASVLKTLPKLPPAPDLSEKNIKVKKLKKLKV